MTGITRGVFGPVMMMSVACGGAPKVSRLPEDSAAKGQCLPISPVPSERVTFLDDAGTQRSEGWAQLTKAEILGLLPNQECLSSTTQLDATGGATFLSAGITAEAGEYTSTLDYALFRVEPITPGLTASNRSGQAHVGVTIRIKADVMTTKAGVNLGSLMAIGAAAQEQSASGRLQVFVIGVDSADIVQLFPTPTVIDQTSIQKTLEAVASIKAKIADPQTTLRPHTFEVCLANADKAQTVTAAKQSLLQKQ